MSAGQPYAAETATSNSACARCSHCGLLLYRAVKVRPLSSGGLEFGGFNHAARLSSRLRAASEMALISDDPFGSLPGDQGNGNVSKHDDAL
jgi:hypothetical protein